MIPVNIWLLGKAVDAVNRESNLTGEQQLKHSTALEIAVRMNEIREKGIEFHSALQMAAKERTDLSAGEAGYYRKAIARYGQDMQDIMRRRGYVPVGVPKKKAGARIARTLEKNGQYRMFD